MLCLSNRIERDYKVDICSSQQKFKREYNMAHRICTRINITKSAYFLMMKGSSRFPGFQSLEFD